jgi:pyruvate dehydrogenase E2 component (dihydrolipoamide acetyltransferase)
MAYEVVVPRLGLTMDEARVVDWYRENGESIEAGEPLYAVETDKVVQDVEAPMSGVVYRVPGLPDAPLPIGTPIAYLLKPNEKPPVTEIGEKQPLRDRRVDKKPEELQPQQTEPSSSNLTRRASPAARRRAEELGIDWHTLERPDGGPILLAQVEQAADQVKSPPTAGIKASPLAKRMAESAGINLEEIAAQTQREKITRADVEAYIHQKPRKTIPLVTPMESGLLTPMSQTRQIIAQRMAESAHTTAPVTLMTEADATELASIRQNLIGAYERRGWIGPSFTELMIELVCAGLQEHPALNSTLLDGQIYLNEEINIAVAVDTEFGLVAPVIRDVSSKNLKCIGEETRDLVTRAQARQLAKEELQGGTFTITNLGMFGIDGFTPIINLPQCAILGMGRIVSKPAEFEAQVALRDMMTLSLTFDHRVVDGGPAARFLNTVRSFVEDPYLWLVI